MKSYKVVFATVAAAALAAGGLASVPQAVAQMQTQPLPDQPTRTSASVFDMLSNDPRFVTTMKMVYVAGAANRLSTTSNVTVFAATDDGWDRSPFEGMLSSLSSTGASSEFPDSADIVQVLRGFFVHGEPPAATGQDARLQSAAGRPIEFDGRSMTVKWVDPRGGSHSAPVAGQPIVAANGIIYPVDAVVGQ